MQINFSVGANVASHTCSLSSQPLTYGTLAATEDVTSPSISLTILKKYSTVDRPHHRVFNRTSNDQCCADSVSVSW